MRYNSLNFYFALAAIFISAAANAQQVPNISDVLHGSQLPNVPTLFALMQIGIAAHVQYLMYY